MNAGDYRVYTGPEYACIFAYEPTGWVRTGTFDKNGRVSPKRMDWDTALKSSVEANYDSAYATLRRWMEA